jgi:hypothetical protein
MHGLVRQSVFAAMGLAAAAAHAQTPAMAADEAMWAYQGPWSDPQRFVLKPPPASPALEAPAVGERGLVFRWRAVPGASYHYQVARDAAFSDLIAQGPTKDAEAVVVDPQPGVVHLRVRTIDADGFEGPYGTAQQVEVPRRFDWWLLLLLLPLLTL